MNLSLEWPGSPTERTLRKFQAEMDRPLSQMQTGDAQ